MRSPANRHSRRTGCPKWPRSRSETSRLSSSPPAARPRFPVLAIDEAGRRNSLWAQPVTHPGGTVDASLTPGESASLISITSGKPVRFRRGRSQFRSHPDHTWQAPGASSSYPVISKAGGSASPLRPSRLESHPVSRRGSAAEFHLRHDLAKLPGSSTLPVRLRVDVKASQNVILGDDVLR